jgi:type IV secretion system protein VirB9
MKKTIIAALAVVLVGFASLGESAETWNAVSRDVIASVSANTPKGGKASVVLADEDSEPVEIEYKGKLLYVEPLDLVLMDDKKGGQEIGLADPAKYAEQWKTAPQYGVKRQESFPAGELNSARPSNAPNRQEITAREYEEERRARRWTELVDDLKLRAIDEKALSLVKEYGAAKDAVPPVIGATGAVVLTYSSYTPRIVCRPMYVTDVILQPGEVVNGVHPGDSVRWTFFPGKSGSGSAEQVHVLIKPLMADISTNVVINTDRRTYLLDLMSSKKNFMPSVSFNYPDDSIRAWDSFIADKRKTREDASTISTGYAVNPEDIHVGYEVSGKGSLSWKPVRVWDDGVKTYIQFRKGSTRKSVEAPVFVVYEKRKEILVNYHVANDLYIVDRIFSAGALIVGTGKNQDRVIIKRVKE